MTWYDLAWPLWIVAFCVIEGIAIFSKNWGGTLSDHVWEWFSINKKGWLPNLKKTSLAAFLIWLTVHFLTGSAW